MRNLILSALILASAFQTALGEQDGDWTYTVSNGQATITRWNWDASGGAVTIPSEVNGIPVVRIESEYGIIFGAIWNNYINYNITSITIPDSMRNIGKNAFYGLSALTSVVIPNSVTEIGERAFMGCISLQNIVIPDSVTNIRENAFSGCTSLTNFTMPDRFIAQVAQIGLSGQVATDYIINALANNDAFVTAVANKIKVTEGNYGLATQNGLSFSIEALATKSQLAEQVAFKQAQINALESALSYVTSSMSGQLGATQGVLATTQTELATMRVQLATAMDMLATKAELTSSLAQSRTDGINSVLSNPNLWTLYTTSQIQNMAMGDLVLTKQVNGQFMLNYDIEQSEDLQTWTTYQAMYMPLTGLPTDKAFVRIKMINSTSNPPLSTASGSNL